MKLINILGKKNGFEFLPPDSCADDDKTPSTNTIHHNAKAMLTSEK